MTESGNWISCKPQIVEGITYRKGDAYGGENNPELPPDDGMWTWRSAKDRWDGGPALPFASGATGTVRWGQRDARVVQPEPVIADYDLLRGKPVIDERATLAAKNRAFERAQQLPEKPRGDPEEEYRAMCKRQGMESGLPSRGSPPSAEAAKGAAAPPRAAPEALTLEDLLADRVQAEQRGDVEVLAKIDAAIAKMRG